MLLKCVFLAIRLLRLLSLLIMKNFSRFKSIVCDARMKILDTFCLNQLLATCFVFLKESIKINTLNNYRKYVIKWPFNPFRTSVPKISHYKSYNFSQTKVCIGSWNIDIEKSGVSTLFYWVLGVYVKRLLTESIENFHLIFFSNH